MDGITYRSTGIHETNFLCAWDVVEIGGGHLDMIEQGLQLCEVLGNGLRRRWKLRKRNVFDIALAVKEMPQSLCVAAVLCLAYPKQQWPGVVLSKQTSTAYACSRM